MNMRQSQPIPVEKGWPLLGIVPKLFSGDPFEYLKNVMLEHGDFVQLNIGPQPVYLISHPDYLKRVLQENYQNYRKPDMVYKATKEVARNGLIVSDGALWLRQRRMIQPHLHRKQLAHLFSEMTEATSQVLDRWTLLAKNNTEVELGEKMEEITINIILRTMFGKDALPEEDIRKVGISAVRMTKYIGETLYSSLLPEWFPIPGRKMFLYDRSVAQEIVNKIIAKCREEKETTASLIQMLIHSVDEESQQQMTEQQLFDEVITIFLAGNETTATALSWLGVVIQEYPDVLAKLQAEIDQVLGGRNPSFEDVPRLAYTRQVFMEILRMYTVVPILPRALNQADQLGQYHLPVNATVLVFYYGMHRNPRIWDNPEVFDPERFTPENMIGRHAFSYLPFSAGPRKCAGDEFALLEGILVIAMLLQKYNLNTLPNQTFEARFGATMHPRNGVKVTFSTRTAITS